MVDITIEAPLPPRGKDRPGQTRDGRRYTPAATKRWEAALALMAQAKLPPNQIEGPIRVDILAALQRSKPMCERYKRDNAKRGIRAGQCKYPEGLIWHTKTPDSDNIRKIVLDALKAFWRDDSQVVCGETLKVYHEIDGRPRVVVRIRMAEKSPQWYADILGLTPPVEIGFVVPMDVSEMRKARFK